MTCQQDVRLQLAVVILNYQTPDMVIDCIYSLEGQIVPDEQKVIVVDNCSGDDSVDLVQRAINSHDWGAWVDVVRSPVNGGFAAGNNLGIRTVDAEVYLLLNSDTMVRKDAIATMCKSLADQPNVHMLGPRLEWPDGEQQVSCFRNRTPISEMLYASSLGLLWKRFPKHVVAIPTEDRTTRPDWISFACVLIRSEVFDRIGLLDDTYFMYFEDMDFCRRARDAGFEIAFEENARVVHLHGGSSSLVADSKKRKRRAKFYYNARAHYFTKFYGKLGRVRANLLWELGWLIGLLRGKTGAVEKEYKDIWSSPIFNPGEKR